jgi:hypothetical protein
MSGNPWVVLPYDSPTLRSFRYLVCLLAVTAFVLLSLAPLDTVLAGQVQLAWDASTGASGYRVYYGPQSYYDPQSAGYSANFDAGNKTTATVTDLAAGETYYFAVQAYAQSVTSGYSNEVVTV